MEDHHHHSVYTLNDILLVSNLVEEARYQKKQGWGNENLCTFENGYIKMNVYSCKTCQELEGRHVGVCFGCSMDCHLYHDVVELFEKRNFRCDCKTRKHGTCHLPSKATHRLGTSHVHGTSKDEPVEHGSGLESLQDGQRMGEQNIHGGKSMVVAQEKEKLGIKENGDVENGGLCMERKVEINDRNQYNDNFKGLFCWCKSEYKEDDVMIQCMLCEDWYHDTCIKKVYEGELHMGEQGMEAEYVCRTCMDQHPCLKFYTNLLYDKQEVNEQGDIVCPTMLQSDGKGGEIRSDAFFRKGWYQSLCGCEQCKKWYEKTQLDQIVDSLNQYDSDIDVDDLNGVDDLDEIVSELDRETKKRNVEDENNELPQSKRVARELTPYQNAQLALGYNDFVTALKEYLKSYSESGKVVTEEDINRFFKMFHEEKNKDNYMF